MDTGFIKLNVADHVALVTMERAPVNAVNAAFHDDLMRVFDTLSDRDDVRVAILTGAGRVFCAGGADIKARAGQGGATPRRARLAGPRSPPVRGRDGGHGSCLQSR